MMFSILVNSTWIPGNLALLQRVKFEHTSPVTIDTVFRERFYLGVVRYAGFVRMREYQLPADYIDALGDQLASTPTAGLPPTLFIIYQKAVSCRAIAGP